MTRDLIFSATRDDFEITTQPRGGPGGQHRNRVHTGVRITHKPTGLTASCFSEKSQLQNRKTAFRLLCAQLVERFKPGVEQREPATETVRTYHGPDNRVKDHLTGEQRSYRNVVELADEMFDELVDGRAGAARERKPV